MTPTSHNAPTGASVPVPGPKRGAIALLACVAAATAAMLALSAGVALRPLPTVTVRPALFAETEPAPDEPGRTAATPTVQAPGWIEPDPFTIAAAALTDGVVDEILVLEGQSVEAGQVVARLVDEDARLAVSRAEADLAASEAELEAAKARLRAAETDWAEPVERERAVAAAKAERDRTDAQIAQLPALVGSARAHAERLAEELERTEQAFRSGAANEIEAVVARKRLDGARADLDALERRAAILDAERERASADLAAARRNAELRTDERLALEAAYAALARARAGVDQARAARDEAALRLERTVIRAPISGLVQRRYKYPGAKVMAAMDDPDSTHIVHLYDPEKLQVRVDVPLADAAHVRAGQDCEVVVEILPDRVFRGVVDRITHQADLQKNTLQIKVRVIDPDPIVKPEMLARVRFLGSGGRAEAASGGVATPVLVPETALSGPDNARVVRVVRERRAGVGRLVAVPVTVTRTDAGWAAVEADLRPGDLLALDPPADARRVRIAIAEDPS